MKIVTFIPLVLICSSFAIADPQCAWLLQLEARTETQKALTELAFNPVTPPQIRGLFYEEIWNRLLITEVKREEKEASVYFNAHAPDYVLHSPYAFLDSREDLRDSVRAEKLIPLRSARDFELDIPTSPYRGIRIEPILVRGLAKIKFEIHLRKNIRKLHERFPYWVRRLRSGTFVMEKNISDFLSLRFAFEMELALSRAFPEKFPMPQLDGADADDGGLTVSRWLYAHPGYDFALKLGSSNFGAPSRVGTLVNSPLREILGAPL